MGRTASGVRGIRRVREDYVVGGSTYDEGRLEVLVITEKGYGKTDPKYPEYPVKGRAEVKGMKQREISQKKRNSTSRIDHCFLEMKTSC